jgi:hypothetical protein
MRRRIIDIYIEEFDSYFRTKSISPAISKKFLSAFHNHIKENESTFKKFWEFIKENRELSIDESIKNLNHQLLNNKKNNKTIVFVSDWCHSYLGAGEIICLLISDQALSGGKRYPDLLFKNTSKKIEIKAYADNFRLTEATSFFTDLGTIIQALVQGGFMNSLTDSNNNDLRKGLRHFCESFLCPRGYIELNSKIWKLESKSDDTMIFKISPETSKEIVSYSIVRNSLRNWLGRGMLSVKLAEIIDPTRSTRIQKKEVHEYVNHILGIGEIAPIPLEQYFILCGLDSMIIYERKNKNHPFQIVRFEDLSQFTLDRMGQGKVSYKRKSSIKSPKSSKHIRSTT